MVNLGNILPNVYIYTFKLKWKFYEKILLILYNENFIYLKIKFKILTNENITTSINECGFFLRLA